MEELTIENVHSATIAIYDLDKTFITCESLYPFTRFLFRRRLLSANSVLPLSTAFFSPRSKRGDRFKQALLHGVLCGKDELEEYGAEFAERLRAYLRLELYKQFQRQRAEGVISVLLTRALDVYAEPFARSIGFDHVIASCTEQRVDGVVLHPADKKRATRSIIHQAKAMECIGYGNRDDLPWLVQLDTFRVYE